MYMPTGRVDLDQGLGDFDVRQFGSQVLTGVMASPGVYYGAGKMLADKPVETLRALPRLVTTTVETTSPGTLIGIALPAAALAWWLFGSSSSASSGRRRR